MDQRGEDLEDRLLDFAARVGKLVDALARESRQWTRMVFVFSFAPIRVIRG
ncbi:hypothetical protein [Neorhodopirellula lusitana]|uniref:hypothetical protein n=1 Tax=Neorhodopirellula lusitana TaxID=445327 RepID=UPI00384C0C86